MRTNPNEQHSCVNFLKSLYQHCKGGFIHILLIDRAGIPINKFISIEKLDSIPSLLKAYRGYNVYFGVATRLNGDMTKEGIIEIPCLWVDIDLTDKSGVDLPNKEEIVQRLREFRLKPSFLVNSGGGIHAYWKLKTPFSKSDIRLAESLLKSLASYLGGDKTSTDASHNLRLPGSLNYKSKYKTPRKVTVEEFHPENEYNPGNFDFLSEIEETLTGEEKPRLPEGWEKGLLDGVSEGERNGAITQLAGRYVGKGLSRCEVLPILVDTNSRFKPPLALKEIETCLDSILKTHQRNHPDETPDLTVKSFSLPTLGDICDLDIKVEWVVEKLIPKQAVTVLHGKGGIGKTWLMLQLGSCVAEGTSFCGLATQKMPCYYIDFENSLATLHDRGVILGRSNLQVWHISNPIPPPRLDSKEWVRYKDLPPGLLIFDTLRAAQLLDENSSKDMTTIMMCLKVLRDLGFTPALIHHTPKSDERTYKGSTAIQDQCDHVLSLDRVRSVGSEQEIDGDEEDWDHPLRLGVRGKTRYEPFSIYLQFDPSRGFEVAPDPDDEPLKEIHSLVIGFKEREGTPPNQSQLATLAKDVGINRKRMLRLLRKGEGRLWRPQSNSQTRAILYDPIFIIPLSPTIYRGNNGTMESKTGPVIPSGNKTKSPEPIEKTLFTHCSDTMKNKGITESEFNLLGGEI